MDKTLFELFEIQDALLAEYSIPIYTTKTDRTSLLNVKRYVNSDAYNVKDYGAVGNDIVDDTDTIKLVIELAKANNKNVYFPAGTYKITDSLYLHSNMTVFGDGTSTCIKMYNDGCLMTDENLSKKMKYIFVIEKSHDITIRDIKIDGNAQSTIKMLPKFQSGSYHGIYLLEAQVYSQNSQEDNIYNINVLNCYFTNCWNAGICSSRYSVVIPKYASKITVEGCYFYNIGAHGVGMNYWKDSIVTNCIFEKCGQHELDDNQTGGGLGVDVSGGCINVLVTNNIVTGSPGAFKSQPRRMPDENNTLLETKYVTFANNICYNMRLGDEFSIFYNIKLEGENIKCVNNYLGTTSGRGIYVGDLSQGCVISDNIIEPQALAGIELRALQDTNNIYNGNHIVKGNVIKGGSNHGILISCDNNIIENNNVTKCKYSGIKLAKGFNNIIRGNITSDNESYGIDLYPAGGDVTLHDNIIVESNISFNSDVNNKIQKRGISVEDDIRVKLFNNITFNNASYNVYPGKARQFTSEWFKREILCEYYDANTNYAYYKVLTNLKETVFNLEITFNHYDSTTPPQRVIINGYASKSGFYSITHSFLNNTLEIKMPTIRLKMENENMVIFVDTVKKNTSLFVKLTPVGYTEALSKNNETFILKYYLTNDYVQSGTDKVITSPLHKGTTEQMQSITNAYVGYQFFNITDNKMYYWNNGWF